MHFHLQQTCAFDVLLRKTHKIFIFINFYLCIKEKKEEEEETFVPSQNGNDLDLCIMMTMTTFYAQHEME